MPEHDRVARMAMMIRAKPGVSGERLAQTLARGRKDLLAAYGGRAELRLGVKYQPDPLEALMGEGNGSTVDAAVEFTASEDSLDLLFKGAPAAMSVLRDVIDPSRTILMGGVTRRIIAPKAGDTFLSLTFRRDPKITSDEFSDWWFQRHAPLAVSLLCPLMIGYDQVHVDHEGSAAAAATAGLQYEGFDAYDNLTWDSPEAYAASLNEKNLLLLFQDEQGFIDRASATVGLMNLLPDEG